MTAQPQHEREKTWLEKLEEFLGDEFHHGLYRVICETLWAQDIRVGAWSDPLDVFRCLDNQYAHLVANQTKPAHLASHLQGLNFSGKETVSGVGQEFFQSQLPCNRQKILLLHSLRLILENKDKDRVNLSLIIPIIRREIHQCFRLVFFSLKNRPQARAWQEFIDMLDSQEWFQMNDLRMRLADYLISWLEREGVERNDVDDFAKLGSFKRKLDRYISYHPGQTDEPLDFEYVHIFSDWQKVGYFSSLNCEIDRITSLVYLEGLSSFARAANIPYT